MEETVNGEKINEAVGALLQFFMGVSYRDIQENGLYVYSRDDSISASMTPDVVFSPHRTEENERSESLNFVLEGDISSDGDVAMLEEQVGVEICAYSMLPFLDITGITSVTIENDGDKEKLFEDINNFVSTGRLPEILLHPLVVCDMKNLIGKEGVGYDRFIVRNSQVHAYNPINIDLWDEEERQQARTFAIALYNAKRLHSEQPFTFEHALLKLKDFPFMLAHNQEQYLVIRSRDFKSFMVGDDIYKGIIALAEKDNTQYAQDELEQIKNAIALSLEVEL